MSKPNRIKVDARITEIVRLRLSGAEHIDICEFVREQEQKADTAWTTEKPLSDSQLWRYQKKADDVIAETCRVSRKRLLSRHLAQRRDLYAKSVNAGDIRTALSCLDSEARLLHLDEKFPDTKQAAEGKDAPAPMGTSDVVKLLSEQLRDINESDLPTIERTRQTTALAESLLRAIGIDTIAARLESLQAVLLARKDKVEK